MSESDGTDGTANTTRERVRGGRPVSWFLVDGNRGVVAAVLLGAVYVLLVVLGRFAPGSATKLFRDPDPVFALFTPIIIGIIMGVSLVLTFNQLVLSQELGAAGEQRERMQEAIAFRDDVETAVGKGTSPPEPSMFLRGLVDATGDRANALVETLGTEPGDEASGAVRDYAGAISEDARRVSAHLEGQQFGQFEVVKSALDYNYSWKIYRGRRIHDTHAESLPEETTEALDDLLDVLQFFGPAREHFKTLYFRWEIIDVSRALVYTAIPALAVTAYMILTFEADAVAGTTAGIDNALLSIGVGLVVGTMPFAIFLSYILRIVTVAKWTLAMGPFILRETDRAADLDWE